MGFRPEVRLLLGSTRTTTEPRDLQALIPSNLDWQSVVEKAIQQEIAPLIHSNLKKMTNAVQIPQDIAEQFQVLYDQSASKNTNLYSKLEEILLAFSEQSIPVVVLKGAALAQLVYRDVALRRMKDLDVLVHREHLDTAVRILHALQYVPVDHKKRPKEWYRDSHHHLVPYVSSDQSLRVDLHYHIVHPKYVSTSLSIPIHDLWQRSLPLQIGSVTTHVWALEDFLLHLCLHLAYSNRFINGKLKDLCDIAEFISWYREQIDWTQFLRQVKAYKVEKYIYYAFWLSQMMMNANVPIEVVRSLESCIYGRPLEDRLLKFFIPRLLLLPSRRTYPNLVRFPKLNKRIARVCVLCLDSNESINTPKALCNIIWQMSVSSAQRNGEHADAGAPG